MASVPSCRAVSRRASSKSTIAISESRIEKHCHSNGSCTNNHCRSCGLAVRTEDAAFEAGEKCIRHCNRRTWIDPRGQRVQGERRMSDTHVLGMCVVDTIPQCPAGCPAVGGDFSRTELTGTARDHTRDPHWITDLRSMICRSKGFNNTLILHGRAKGRVSRWNVEFENMQVSAADGGVHQL